MLPPQGSSYRITKSLTSTQLCFPTGGIILAHLDHAATDSLNEPTYEIDCIGGQSVLQEFVDSIPTQEERQKLRAVLRLDAKNPPIVLNKDAAPYTTGTGPPIAVNHASAVAIVVQSRALGCDQTTASRYCGRCHIPSAVLGGPRPFPACAGVSIYHEGACGNCIWCEDGCDSGHVHDGGDWRMTIWRGVAQSVLPRGR